MVVQRPDGHWDHLSDEQGDSFRRWSIQWPTGQHWPMVAARIVTQDDLLTMMMNQPCEEPQTEKPEL